MTILITAICFFFIGYWARKPKLFKKEVKETIDDIVEQARKPKKRPKAGVIPFKTPQDFEDDRTGETALDDEWKKTKGKILE